MKVATLHQNFVTRLSTLAVVVLCSVGFLLSAVQPLHAQTFNGQNIDPLDRESLIGIIQGLLARLVITGDDSDTGAFNDEDVADNDEDDDTDDVAVGSSIETTDNLRVRDAAGSDGRSLTVQSPGSKGRVERGPLRRDGHTWWYVRYDNGRAGWSAENWLRKKKSQGTSYVDGRDTEAVDDEKDEDDKDDADADKKIRDRLRKDGRIPVDVDVDHLTLNLTYKNPNGCIWYTVKWGDGSSDREGSNPKGKDCTQAVETVTISHTYEEAGTYRVRVYGNTKWRRTITVGDPEPDSDAFTIADVASVQAEYVDPMPNAVDDEYTKYTITRKNGDVDTVRIGFMPSSMIEQRFRDIGYIGSIKELLALAKKRDVSDPKPDTRVDVRIDDLTVTLSYVHHNGCVWYDVAWGDGNSDAMGSNPENKRCTQALVPVKISHTYEAAGTYKISMTGNRNYSQTVVVEEADIDDEEDEDEDEDEDVKPWYGGSSESWQRWGSDYDRPYSDVRGASVSMRDVYKALLSRIESREVTAMTVMRDTAELTFGANAYGYAKDTSGSDLQKKSKSELLDMIRTLLAKRSDSATHTDTARGHASNADSTTQVGIGTDVKTTARLRLRDAAGLSGGAVKTIGFGVMGTVTRGPVRKNGHTWWYVEYDDGDAGCSAGGWLKALQKRVNSGDAQFPVLSITPPAGLAPLAITVRSKHTDAAHPDIDIRFSEDGEWVPLAGCQEMGDTRCIVAGKTEHTYEIAGVYTISVRNAVMEREVKKVRVIESDRSAGSNWLDAYRATGRKDAATRPAAHSACEAGQHCDGPAGGSNTGTYRSDTSNTAEYENNLIRCALGQFDYCSSSNAGSGSNHDTSTNAEKCEAGLHDYCSQ